MLKVICIGVLLHFSGVQTLNVLYENIDRYHNDTYNKSEHAYQVVDKIYNAFRQWFFTITFCEFTYFENRILKYTETMDDGYPVLLLNGCPSKNRTKSKPKINIHGETAYVITAPELNLDGSEYIIEALVRTGVFKPRSTLIFVLNVPVTIDDYFHYTLKNHFQFLWSRRVTNSVVVLMVSNKLWTYAYNFFTDEVVDVSDIEDVNHWLTHQYDDLNGHELRLSVFKKIYEYQDNVPVYCDSRLVRTVMKQMNATCKAMAPRDGNTVGDLLSNGTSTGVTADLMEGYTDLELNSRILKNSYYGYIDTSYPLTEDELCFMVKNLKKLSTFTTVIQLISGVILCILIFNVVTLVTIAIIARKLEMKLWNIVERKSIGEIILQLVRCFIKQSVDVKLPAFIYRIIVLLIIIYSLIVNCVLDAIITSSVTYPRYGSNINNMDELVKSNLTLGVHKRHFRMFNSSLDNETYELVKNRIEQVNDRKIREVIWTRQYQYALLLKKSDLMFITRNVSNIKNGRSLFRIIQDCPLQCKIVYGLRYGSPYLNKLNSILHHLNQGGILQNWAKRSEELKVNQRGLTPDNKELRKLSLSNVQELFVVWAFGLLLSTIIFLLEIISKCKRNY